MTDQELQGWALAARATDCSATLNSRCPSLIDWAGIFWTAEQQINSPAAKLKLYLLTAHSQTGLGRINCTWRSHPSSVRQTSKSSALWSSE